ncbi:hypothetical protein ES674_01405 [Bizionia myxarmorum]|uniref:Uncharacterized protein n=1 Tax=Bizionia myxarmorum TaxID=291186 RepID=A0A5D0RFN8_9FLAO|nr:hypothetical protein ES674_01405 [Bizionia myxarmorum]
MGFGIAAIGLLALTSCSSNDDEIILVNNICDVSYVSTPITDLFSTANGYDDLPEYMDLETHQYRMKINANGEICSVGYQNPSTWTGSYLIVIKNETTSLQTSAIRSFSQAQLEYKSITPLVVNSGDIVSVERTIFGYTSISETVGRILRKSDYTDVPYPIVQGNVEFLSSNFYGAGGPVPNIGQPYIPVGFRLN